MRVVFQSPVTKVWYCVFTEHIECDGDMILVRDGSDETVSLIAYEGEDALSQFEHLIEYGRIYNANK